MPSGGRNLSSGQPAGLLTWDFSALGGTRTPNLLIRSQMLYPLSYERRVGKCTPTAFSASVRYEGVGFAPGSENDYLVRRRAPTVVRQAVELAPVRRSRSRFANVRWAYSSCTITWSAATTVYWPSAPATGSFRLSSVAAANASAAIARRPSQTASTSSSDGVASSERPIPLGSPAWAGGMPSTWKSRGLPHRIPVIHASIPNTR